MKYKFILFLPGYLKAHLELEFRALGFGVQGSFTTRPLFSVAGSVDHRVLDYLLWVVAVLAYGFL